MKNFIFFVIVLAAGIVLGIYFQKQSETPKGQNQTVAEQAGDAVKEGVETAETVATNVAAHVKAGAQKAGEVVTNVVGEVKNKLN